jgi:hypothetical protein
MDDITENVEERVHIVPMGVEDDRITEAATKYKSEQVVLLRYIPPSERMREKRETITQRLEEERIEYSIKDVNFEDLFEDCCVHRSHRRTPERYCSR